MSKRLVKNGKGIFETVQDGGLVPSVSYYQTGSVEITAQSQAYGTYAVSFSEPMPDTDYIVVLSINGLSGFNWHNKVFNVAYDDKTVNGFTVVVGKPNDTDIEEGVTVKWQAFKLMTDESRAIDEQAIAQNASDIAALKTFGKKVLWTGSVTRGGTISLDSTGYDELYAICGGARLRCVSTSRGKNVRHKFVAQWNGRDNVQEGALGGYYKQDYILDILVNGTVATCGWFTNLGTTADDSTYHGQYINENNINCTQIIGVKYPTIAAE